MNDPCKSCGVIKCAAYEACHCCGKCRNCGQEAGKHAMFSPYVVQPFVIPNPVPVYPVYPQPVYPNIWWSTDFGTVGTDVTCAIPPTAHNAFALTVS